ncbi:hypothetical protein [Streptomyces thermolilacinus]|uniref:SWIM-type domain-containing protein n=1 Tax=Streptomyces thermolilacinus SPC6 TaxID=1306406 RepID=A0A1D3DZ71_9ACTN|nr:hypothetical protein [Streptomyces thermolilacinus]OEJ97620.1 hypothetical protein J116_027365 [Streptomyces thermolilacinus SPC6]
MSQLLPPVAPSVTAELVGALPPRLLKRLDAGVAKLAARPVVADGDVVRIAVDDDTELELHAAGGVVSTADGIRCGCLLSPACLHRAAAASAAPVAEAGADTDTDADAGASDRADAGDGADAGDSAGAGDGVDSPGVAGGGSTAAGAAPVVGGGASGDAPAGAEGATPEQGAAADAVLRAASAVLEAGTDGAGAVVQAELLRAAHTARLAGLPRAAAAAVSVVTRLRAARSADPAYRLSELADQLRELLRVAHRVPLAAGAELTELRGTARRLYTPDGSLRLYGLFSEPVLTASGYAGAVTWTADTRGRLFSVSDVAPGGPGRATGAADRAVRVGDTALTHRELSRAGLAVSGATVSEDGRLGAGAGVRAVRASGAGWDAEPLDRLWAVPVAGQAARALDAGDAGNGLLFLDVTVLGAVREAAGVCLVADCGGLTVRLTAAHDDPALPYRDNLRLLASVPGIRLRAVARLDPAPHPRARLLAVSHPSDAEARVDLGFDRLQRADLPADVTGGGAEVADAPFGDQAPVHVLRRRVHQAVSAGRRVLALPHDTRADTRRLRAHGLGTAAELLDHLHTTAAGRPLDPFGRLRAADPRVFARAWLAAAAYTDEVDRALCAAAWGAGPAVPDASAS